MEKTLCINIKELQKKLGVSRTCAYNLANNPSFYPAFKLGDRILIKRDLLEQWLDEQIAKKYDLYAAISRIIDMYIESRFEELPMLSVDEFKAQIMDCVSIAEKCKDPRLNAIVGASMFVKAAACRIMKEEKQ